MLLLSFHNSDVPSYLSVSEDEPERTGYVVNPETSYFGSLFFIFFLQSKQKAIPLTMPPLALWILFTHASGRTSLY